MPKSILRSMMKWTWLKAHVPEQKFAEGILQVRIVVATPPDDQSRVWSSIQHTTNSAARGSGATKCSGEQPPPFPRSEYLSLG